MEPIIKCTPEDGMRIVKYGWGEFCQGYQACIRDLTAYNIRADDPGIEMAIDWVQELYYDLTDK